jgi:uncharacterized membrane protein
MASATFNTLQFLHVVGAMVVVGYLAVIPMWRAAVSKSSDATVVAAFLRSVTNVQNRVVLPALGLLILTGLLMVVGPLREGYDLVVSRWAQGGLVLSLVLGFILVTGVAGPTRKMLPLVEKGEATGPAMEKLWGDWRTAVLSAAVLALAATALMVYGALQ